MRSNPDFGDTIFAVSSGAPPTAIAVLRISGLQAQSALAALCPSTSFPLARRATVRHLYHPDSGTLLDSALVLWFPGPNSASGEDTVELHLHGGRAVIAAVEKALLTLTGLRRAEAGEFTRRAFINGRIDLAEAEGLADLLAAESESQRKQALAAAQGHVSRRVTAWQEQIISLSAYAEAELHFGDDVVDVVSIVDATEDKDIEDSYIENKEKIATSIQQGDSKNPPDVLVESMNILATQMQEWLARPAAERIHDGLLLVIAGPANSGKSTLINAIAQREVAIVSSFAGTTRDIVEIPLALDDIAVRLADTAGLRDLDDLGDVSDSKNVESIVGVGNVAGIVDKDIIEAIGISRAHDLITVADMLLWLGEPATAPDHPCCLTIAAQADRRIYDPDWPEICATSDVVISAHSGEGMADLHHAIVTRARGLLPGPGEVALHQRQRAALREACDWLTIAGRIPDIDAMDATSPSTSDILLLAEHLRLAARALDKITGRAGVDDMLDVLFARFCIGK